jgi:hypothetical protein
VGLGHEQLKVPQISHKIAQALDAIAEFRQHPAEFISSAVRSLVGSLIVSSIYRVIDAISHTSSHFVEQNPNARISLFSADQAA